MPQSVISVSFSGQQKIKVNVNMLRENLPVWVAEANRETGAEVRDKAQANIKQIDAFDTGELHNSIRMEQSANGLAVIVGSVAKHAPFIEFGTAPHFPPVAKIAAWCARKGIPVSAAYPIARAISIRGTPERPWLYPAFKASMRRHIDRLRGTVAIGLRKLA